MPKRKKRYIIGIDEVGRGSLAGPVVVAAVAAPTKFRIDPSGILRKQNLKLRINKDINSEFFFCQRQIPGGSILNSKLAKLKDSKKLSPKQREIWFQYIKNLSNLSRIKFSNNSNKSRIFETDSRRRIRGKFEKHIYYAVASVSPKVIDKINISNAANLAATRAFQKLVNTLTIVRVLTKNNKISVKIFLDGGLYLNKNLIRINQQNQQKSASTIIKGDEKIPAIMLASIVAKVTRDRMMRKLHKKYPKYGFDRHKGYGTKKHFKMIRKYGLSPIHRKSFNSKKRNV